MVKGVDMEAFYLKQAGLDKLPLRVRRASITRVAQRHDTFAGGVVLERSEGQKVDSMARVTSHSADGGTMSLLL